MQMRFLSRRLRSDGWGLALCVLVLGGAVGSFAAVAMFANALLRRPIELKAPNRVVRLSGLADPVLEPPLKYWGEARSLESLAKWETGPTDVTIEGQQRILEVAAVSPAFFSIFDGEPVVGRLLDQVDFQSSGPTPVVISNTTWRERFGSNPSALGSHLRISNLDCVLVGVARSDFAYPNLAAAWIPATLSVETLLDRNGRRRLRNGWVGKLAADASLEQCRQEIRALLERLNTSYTPKTHYEYGNLTKVELLIVALARPVRATVLALLAGAGFVLLLAWANTATILFARLLERRAEFAVRLSLGATVGQLLRGVGMESVIVGIASGLCGGAASLWVFHASTPLFGSLVSLAGGGTRVHPLTVLTVSSAAGGLLGLLAGLLPAILTAAWRDWDILKRRAPSTVLPARRFRTALVFVQVVVAMVLVVGAGVSLRTFQSVEAVPLGFSTDGILGLKFSVPASWPAKTTTLLDSILSEAVALGAAREAAIIDSVPLVDDQAFISVRGTSGSVMATYSLIHGGYFRTMSIPILRGRDFSPQEGHSIILSETLAKRFWQTRNPLGDTILLEGETSERRVVAVVGEVRSARLEADERELRPQFYLPYSRPYQHDASSTQAFTLVARCSGGCGAATPSLRERLEAHGAHIAWVKPMDDAYAAVLGPSKFRAAAAGLYAAVGLVITFAGIYALFRFLTVMRMYELGIRMAIGASRFQILKLVLGHAFRICIAGAVTGGCIGLEVFRLARSLIYGVSPADPIIYSAAAAIIVAGGLLASVGPVLQLIRRNPLSALLYR